VDTAGSPQLKSVVAQLAVKYATEDGAIAVSGVGDLVYPCATALEHGVPMLSAAVDVELNFPSVELFGKALHSLVFFQFSLILIRSS